MGKEVVYRKLSELKKLPNNPRTIKKDDMERLKKSIKDNPDYFEARPIILSNRTGDLVILAGNQRYEAAKALGMDKVPTFLLEGLTEAREREIIIRDNVSNGDWDMDALANEWDTQELTDWGVHINWDEPDQEVVEDEAPEVDESEPADSVLGGVYQLGRHRLMCGDSTDAGSVAILMNGQKADMVFTDPPYGMKKEADGVLNDNLNYDKLLDFNKKWIPLTFDNLKDNGSWYCWGIDEPLMDIYSNILKPMQKENKITFRNLITWDKGNGQGQMSEEFRMYAVADEKCLFVMCGTMKTTSDVCKGFENGLSTWFEGFEKFRSYFNEQLKKAGLTRSDAKKLTNTSAEHYLNGKEYTAILAKQAARRKEWYGTRAYFNNTHDNMNNVWHFDKTSQEERNSTGGHATPKPLALCQRAIKSSSRADESVLDLFGGSGSTLIACEQLGRKCYMMELDPKYCDVIRKRYWTFVTGSEEGWQDGTKAK